MSFLIFVFRMKLEVILWIHILLSLSRLSACANQNSILGGGSTLESPDPSSSISSAVITDSSLLTSRDVARTSIYPSRVLASSIINVISSATLEPSFASHTLIPHEILTSTHSSSFVHTSSAYDEGTSVSDVISSSRMRNSDALSDNKQSKISESSITSKYLFDSWSTSMSGSDVMLDSTVMPSSAKVSSTMLSSASSTTANVMVENVNQNSSGIRTSSFVTLVTSELQSSFSSPVTLISSKLKSTTLKKTSSSTHNVIELTLPPKTKSPTSTSSTYSQTVFSSDIRVTTAAILSSTVDLSGNVFSSLSSNLSALPHLSPSEIISPSFTSKSVLSEDIPLTLIQTETALLSRTSDIKTISLTELYPSSVYSEFLLESSFSSTTVPQKSDISGSAFGTESLFLSNRQTSGMMTETTQWQSGVFSSKDTIWSSTASEEVQSPVDVTSTNSLLEESSASTEQSSKTHLYSTLIESSSGSVISNSQSVIQRGETESLANGTTETKFISSSGPAAITPETMQVISTMSDMSSHYLSPSFTSSAILSMSDSIKPDSTDIIQESTLSIVIASTTSNFESVTFRSDTQQLSFETSSFSPSKDVSFSSQWSGTSPKSFESELHETATSSHQSSTDHSFIAETFTLSLSVTETSKRIPSINATTITWSNSIETTVVETSNVSESVKSSNFWPKSSYNPSSFQTDSFATKINMSSSLPVVSTTLTLSSSEMEVTSLIQSEFKPSLMSSGMDESVKSSVPVSEKSSISPSAVSSRDIMSILSTNDSSSSQLISAMSVLDNISLSVKTSEIQSDIQSTSYVLSTSSVSLIPASSMELELTSNALDSNLSPYTIGPETSFSTSTISSQFSPVTFSPDMSTNISTGSKTLSTEMPILSTNESGSAATISPFLTTSHAMEMPTSSINHSASITQMSSFLSSLLSVKMPTSSTNHSVSTTTMFSFLSTPLSMQMPTSSINHSASTATMSLYLSTSLSMEMPTSSINHSVSTTTMYSFPSMTLGDWTASVLSSSATSSYTSEKVITETSVPESLQTSSLDVDSKTIFPTPSSEYFSGNNISVPSTGGTSISLNPSVQSSALPPGSSWFKTTSVSNTILTSITSVPKSITIGSSDLLTISTNISLSVNPYSTSVSDFLDSTVTNLYVSKLDSTIKQSLSNAFSPTSTFSIPDSTLLTADGIPSLTIHVSPPAPSQDTMTTHLTSLTPPSITLATATTQLTSASSRLTQDTVIIRPTLDTGSSSSGMPTITFATLPSSTVTLTIAVPSTKPKVSESTLVERTSTSSMEPSMPDSSTAVATPSVTQESSTVSTSPATQETSTVSESLVSIETSRVSESPTTQISSTASVSSIIHDTSPAFITSSSVSVATSSVVLTTPPASLNASTAGENLWVETVLKVSMKIDVSAESFKTDLERRLAEAFEEAFIRQKLIEEGNFDSLRRRKRKKRFTQAGDAAVHIHRVTREPASTTVSTAYSVEKAGSVLQPADAVNALNTLETQELAIILSQVVQSKAEPYIKTETPPQPPGEESKLWIIAAVAGPVVAVVLLVWIILCIYLKCCRSKTPLHDLEEEGAEPELTSIRKPDTKEVTQFSKGRDNPAYSELPRQGSRPALKKGRTYEVSPLPDPEFIKGTKELEQTPLTTPEKKQNRPSTSIQNGSAVKDTSPKDEEIETTPQKKKRAKRRNGSIDPLGPSSPGNTARTTNSDQSNLLSSISGDDEELKIRTETERKKNKDRLREKHQKKKDEDVRAYLESQREIDQVLGVPNGLPDVFIEESSSPSHAKVSRQDSGVSNEPLSGEESLEEARKRMHRLLDDAFTLISPRASFQENDLSNIQRLQAIAKRHRDKVSPMSTPDTSKADSSTNSKSKISTVHLDSTKDLGKHIKHEPMHFDSGYSYKDFPLETWSPYRASDQVALISMPNKVDTKLGGPKKKNGDKERPATSKASRRPAANFEVQESKSAGNLDTQYTSSSPQPIVLRTKDLASLVNANADNRPKEVTKSHENANGKYAMTSINGDVYLTGSTTSLAKHKKKSVPNAGGLEMQPMKNQGWTSSQKHRAPVPNVKDNDEVDVINNIKQNETSDDLIKSLRDELQYLKGNFNVDSKSSKKGRRTSGKSMTEIV